MLLSLECFVLCTVEKKLDCGKRTIECTVYESLKLIKVCWIKWPQFSKVLPVNFPVGIHLIASCVPEC